MINNAASVTGRVHSLETFGLVDGPGVRSVIFLQGCPMRCQYCHNPDTWVFDAGTEWKAGDLFKKMHRYKTYWRDNGGLTISGGEALMQMEFVTAIFTLAKEAGVHTTLDTSGCPFRMTPEYLEKFDRLMAVTDLFMLDIKEMDCEKHAVLTGHKNDNILQMAQYLSDHNKAMWIRHVLVPGVTDEEKGLQDLADFLKTLKTVERTEILPYHTLGMFKWENLGIDYPLKDVMTPTREEVAKAEAILGIVHGEAAR